MNEKKVKNEKTSKHSGEMVRKTREKVQS